MIINTLRPKQKKFVDKYIENGGNGTKAIKDAGYNCKSDKVAGVMAVENLAKPSIKGYLADKGKLAGQTIEILMTTSEKDEVKLKAGIFIYEQVYGKATQKIIGDSNQPLISTELKLKPEQLEKLARIVLQQ